MIQDTQKLKNSGSVERSTCEKLSLLDDTEENNSIASPVGDITQPPTNEQPVSTIRKSIQPEVFNSVHICFNNNKINY